jgi:DNA-binding PadR family transcriptional regulator
MKMPVLDVFVLSLLDRGCNTPYELQRHAGLSQGAAIPALRRLSRANLIRKAEEESATKRPRHRYTLTSAGRRTLTAESKSCLSLEVVPTDLDTILRLADLAMYRRIRRMNVAAMLTDAAEQRERTASAARTQTGQPTSEYLRFRRFCDVARLNAEAHALRALASEIDSGARRTRRSRSHE